MLNNSGISYLNKMISKEQRLMSLQPDFTLIERFESIDVDACKSNLANVFIKIWKLSRLYQLDEEVVLCFSNYYL
jgi:hypothetical protein